MNYILSLLTGAITSIMVLFNGTMSNYFGNFGSSIIIHISGLITIVLVLIITKTKIKLIKGIPIYLYSAGIIGVATVVFTNLSYTNLGVSLTLALGLLGQTLFSILVDHYGLFGMKMVKFNSKKYTGLCLMALGILIMAIL
jgi:transporter family-2 protein